jgi:ribosomal-protein-alanine N-acetyltransferase
MNIIKTKEDIQISILSEDDAEELFLLIYRNREHLSQFGEGTAKKYPDVESVKQSIRACPLEMVRFVIKNNGVIVGFIKITQKNIRLAEIGYYLGKEFTGKGYTKIAVTQIEEYAKNTLEIKELYGVVKKDNIASIKVLQSCGFNKEVSCKNEIALYKEIGN